MRPRVPSFVAGADGRVAADGAMLDSACRHLLPDWDPTKKVCVRKKDHAIFLKATVLLVSKLQARPGSVSNPRMPRAAAPRPIVETIRQDRPWNSPEPNTKNWKRLATAATEAPKDQKNETSTSTTIRISISISISTCTSTPISITQYVLILIYQQGQMPLRPSSLVSLIWSGIGAVPCNNYIGYQHAFQPD